MRFMLDLRTDRGQLVGEHPLLQGRFQYSVTSLQRCYYFCSVCLPSSAWWCVPVRFIESDGCLSFPKVFRR
jgi:hypothetical protein